jgi:drug/metabolite transporter (DMT)-like permease
VSPVVFVLILLAAVMHAAWNTLLKTEEANDRLPSVATLAAVGALCGVPLAIASPLPSVESLPWLAASAALQVCYCLLLVRAYRHGDLSLAYPLMRGTAPPIVALGSIFLFGEELGLAELGGVALISAGIAALTASSLRAGQPRLRPVGWAVATGLLIATYTMIDAAGVRRAGSALGYAAFLHLAFGLGVVAVALAVRRRETIAFARRRLLRGAGGGVLAFAAYSLVLCAYALGALAPVAALRETSVVLGAVLGARLLKEPLGPVRISAAAAVAAGAVLLQL